MKKTTLILLMFAFTFFTYGQTVTKTYTSPSSVTVDGCGTYCVTLPGVSFSAVDFPLGGVITDVNVSISWLKTDGSCGSPATGNSFHNETNFRVNGPVSQSILATPGTWSGGVNSPAVTTIFDQSAASVPSGTPVSGAFLPNGGNLNNFNCLSPIGVWSLSAGDTAGGDPLCVSSYSITITVAPDNVPPTAICQSVTAQLDALGSVTVNASDFDGGSTDNCAGPLTYTINGFSSITYSCASIPGQVINFEVTDASGNTDSCFTSVTIEDNVDPTAICQSVTAQLDASGSVTVNASDFNGGSTDNCAGPLTYTINGFSSITYSCASIPGQVINFEVTDASGNTDSCFTSVTIEDNVPPTAICQSVTAQLDASGSVTVNASDFNGGSTDNCAGPLTYTINGFSSITYSCASIPGQVINFEVTDASGNTDSCFTSVTIEDNVPPIVTCPADITQNNDTGNCSSVVTWTDPVTSDNCGAVTLSYTTAPTVGLLKGDAFPVGTTTVTYVADDGNGNTSSCSFAVIIADTENPTVTCPADIIVSNDTGNCSANVVYTYPVAVDNCNNAVPVSLKQNNEIVNGSLDCAGNESGHLRIFDLVTEGVTKDYNITSIDVGIQASSGLATDFLTVNIYTDNQVVNPFNTYSSPLTDSFAPHVTSGPIVVPAGTNYLLNIPLAANLIAGSTIYVEVITAASADFLMGYGDNNIAPNGETVTGYISCSLGGGLPYDTPATYGFANMSAVITVNGEEITGVTTTQTAGLAPGDPFPVGTTTNTFLATDASGNTATCSFTVTVNDTEDPTWTTAPSNSTVECDGTADPSGAFAAWLISFSGTDNCGTATVTNNSAGLSDLCGATGTETVTFTLDDGNGNSITQDATFTIEDTTDPVWGTPPSNSTVECDGTADPSGAFAAWLISFSGTDNCGTATVTNNSIGLSDLCGATGTETVTFTLTDECGNSITQDATFTIEDTTDPVWGTPPSNSTVECDGTADPSGAFAAWLVSFSGTDTCGTATVTNNSTGLSDLCGATGTETVTFTLTDECGNAITQDATFTIEDTTAPTIICPMDVNVSADPGVCGAEVDFPMAVALDSCGSVTVAQTAGLPTNSFFPVGISTVEFTATDECGNTSVCSFTITITDNEPANTVCQDITIQLDEFGNASIVAADIDGGSTDNCGVASISASQTDFNCADVGDNNVTLTVTDVNGNTSTCIAVVTVEDVTLPVAVCQDITVPLDANGTVTITGMDVGGASTDACGIVSYDLDIDTFDCSNIGANLVVLTVTDPSGNTATCTATVTIEDVTAPVLVCADVTLEVGPDGTLAINPEDLLAYSPTTYNVITISSDNQSNAEGFTDLTVPVTDVAAISFDWDYTTPDGPAFDSFGYLLNGVYTELTDPNGALTQSGNSAVAVVPGDVFGFRSYSFDGGFGAATTTVSNFMPGFNGQFAPANWTELLTNSDGSATFVEIPGGPLSYDACGITILAVDVTEVTCADIGTPIVITVFASDASGNIAACQSTVTVVDLLGPEITCPADQNQDPGAGNLYYAVPDYWANGEATATDNCTDPVVVTSQDPAAGTLLPDGVYTVIMTAEDEYGNIATCNFELTIESQLGVGDHEDLGSIILYPNPANNMVRLSNPDSLELETLSIYDLTGRLVHTTNLEQMGAEISIDVSRYANATYMVIIKGINGTLTKQLIVNNY